MDGTIDNGPHLDPETGTNLLTTEPSSNKPYGWPDSPISKGYLTRMTCPDDLGPHSTTPPLAVQRLSEDLFIDIVQRYVDPRLPIRDLIRLILVCRQWRRTIEGTPSLWCHITGNETLPYLRKGLQMSKQSHLDVYYHEMTSWIGAQVFLEEIGPHIAHWKSLVAVFTTANFPLAELEIKSAPVLERLHLVNKYWRRWGAPITLFGGAPAPPTLKDVRITGLPITLRPLRMVEMRRFKLGAHPSATTTVITRVLRDSPNLHWIELSNIKDQNDLTLTEGTIRLPFLKHLRIFAIPQPMALQILSNVSAPSLHELRLRLSNTENPRTTILPALTPLIPAMRSIASGALTTDLNFNGPLYGIRIGELGLCFRSNVTNSDAGELAKDLFDWLVSQLGGHLMDIPATLSLENCPASPLYADWLGTRVNVTKLRLWHEPLSIPRHPFNGVLPSLSKPNASSSTGWLLPHVEIFETNLTWDGGNWDLVDMIGARRSAATCNSHWQLDEQTPTVSLKCFREIQLSYGGKEPNRDQHPGIEFMRAVQNAAGDANIYWSGVKLRNDRM
ncbi:hypothetical protein M407DRAFT_32154 [Tulasnella calospora MUT 4182]|uniref:F-box domain-containing protein n=1 Tax=Tulasnella calospora MUT 4182 TaxID=1051891 RepID=A0A0C3PTS1_9AGAM|nr:hypothetical protein M407DRAFT_32154 [Tulasnella calospora MUT 4182]